LLLNSKTLGAILQQSQKAAGPSLAALRLSLTDGSACRSPTETAVGTDGPATGVSHIPATPSLPIEALSSFQTTNFRVLLLQPLYEGHFLIRRQTSLWRKTGLIFATVANVARALFAWPLILLHRRQAYYWISLAELHNRYMDEVIVPWVEEITHAVREETDARRIATMSAECVSMQSRHGQVEYLLALRCNASAVLAVLP